jgi:hypothetical protein
MLNYEPMPERTFDAELVNAIANHPAVRPSLGFEGCEGAVDFGPAISDPRNIFLSEGGGVAICGFSGPGCYECHLLYPPGSRGRAAIASSKAMAEFMFANGARFLWGQPRQSDRAAQWHIRQVGFGPAGHGMNPLIGPVAYFIKEAPCHR